MIFVIYLLSFKILKKILTKLMYFLLKTNNQEAYYLIWKSWQLL